jgi:phytoene dehydrogenase-like protein
LSVLVLEARDRIGGRALTQRLDGVDFDVGCEWLHSADRNCFVPIARSLGFELAYEQPRWGEQSFNINFPISEQHAFHAAFDAFEDRLQAAARLPQDTNAADWLDGGTSESGVARMTPSFPVVHARPREPRRRPQRRARTCSPREIRHTETAL